MATVSLGGIVKRYGSATAVDRVSLAAGDGEFVSLLGPSGCGKSTILNIIAGLIEPDEGKVLIGGADVTRRAPKERGIAMVFQDYALYPHMDVAGNLAFPLRATSMPEGQIATKVKQAADILGIGALLGRFPKELSGGQRQRVALGRAIVREPSAFLMDEPLSNLDAKLRVQMRVELKRLSRRLRTTTFYVTHDQWEAMTLSDRIAVLDHGVLHQIGAPLEVYARPANTFVANFMGLMPMNFIEGRLRADGAGAVFDAGGIVLDLSATPFRGVRNEAGRPVLLGVRPEDVSVGHSAAGMLDAAAALLGSVRALLSERDRLARQSQGCRPPRLTRAPRPGRRGRRLRSPRQILRPRHGSRLRDPRSPRTRQPGQAPRQRLACHPLTPRQARPCSHRSGGAFRLSRPWPLGRRPSPPRLELALRHAEGRARPVSTPALAGGRSPPQAFAEREPPRARAEAQLRVGGHLGGCGRGELPGSRDARLLACLTSLSQREHGHGDHRG